VYNGASTLGLALDSLLAQEYRGFRLVISDNASTDATASICESRAATDSRIVYVRQARNIGVVPNYADVLQQAESPYFMWAADDDLWEPAFLGTLVDALERDPLPALACCDYDVHVHSTGERIVHPPEAMPLLDPALGEVSTVLQLLRLPQPTLVYGLFRTASLRAASRTFPNFDFGDLSLLTQAALNGGIRFVPEVLFHAGVADGMREPYSLARRRIPGLKLSYVPYARTSLRAIVGARSLSVADRLRLSCALFRQILTLAHWHEWRSRRA
jgi:hypothetical protein